MSKLKSSKISKIVLWFSLIITGIIFIVYYYLIKDIDSAGVSMVLVWLYFLFCICVVVTLCFSFYHIISEWKDKKCKILKYLIPILCVGFLLVGSYCLGDGTPLEISGYDGKENTYFWLKLADMWIYSIYFLSSITFLSLIVGIFLSYFKKRH